MIAQIKTLRQKQRFLNACRGKLCLGATMPLAFALFGKSQPGRFFAGPTLALLLLWGAVEFLGWPVRILGELLQRR